MLQAQFDIVREKHGHVEVPCRFGFSLLLVSAILGWCGMFGLVLWNEGRFSFHEMSGKGGQKYQKCHFIFHDTKSYDLYVATYACL